jgi:hypothetical protein
MSEHFTEAEGGTMSDRLVAVWTRNGDTIHATPHCPSLVHALHAVRWAKGMTADELSCALIAAPWLHQCRRCFDGKGGPVTCWTGGGGDDANGMSAHT